MPALSFQEEWINKLLRCDKQHTTRPQTDRIKVGDMTPCEMSGEELEAWAWADGFDDFATARCWFEIRYGAKWMHKTWTQIGWHGWVERYFKPRE